MCQQASLVRKRKGLERTVDRLQQSTTTLLNNLQIPLESESVQSLIGEFEAAKLIFNDVDTPYKIKCTVMTQCMATSTTARVGRGVICPCTKPEVYKTDDGKIIVEDELLNFIAVKMRTLSHDEIVLLASNNFSSEWIEESKRVLFEICPTTQRCISHKGPQKDANNIKACLKVLNECGENIPRFVSH